MISLSSKESHALELLAQQEKASKRLFHIEGIIHFIGGFFGWLAVVIFLVVTNALPPEFFAALGVIQMMTLLKLSKDNRLSASLIIVLMLLGHLMFFIGLFESFKLELYHAVILEAFLTLLAFIYYSNQIYHFLQSGFLISLIFALPVVYGHSALPSVILWTLSLMITVFIWVRPKELFSPLRVALMLVQSAYILFLFFGHDFQHNFKPETLINSHFFQFLSLITTFFLASFILYYFKPLRKNLLTLLILALLLYINWFAYQPVSLPLLFLALSFYSNEKSMQVFSLVVLAIFLFYYYYMLTFPLDEKGFILMITGLILLFTALIIKRLKALS